MSCNICGQYAIIILLQDVTTTDFIPRMRLPVPIFCSPIPSDVQYIRAPVNGNFIQQTSKLIKKILSLHHFIPYITMKLQLILAALGVLAITSTALPVQQARQARSSTESASSADALFRLLYAVPFHGLASVSLCMHSC